MRTGTSLRAARLTEHWSQTTWRGSWTTPSTLEIPSPRRHRRREDEDPNESPEYRQTTTTVAESNGVAAAAASLRAHRSAVDAALREYTRQCELLGGVEAAFSEVARGNPVETEANRAAALAARALANALVVWADDVPASKDGRTVSFDTWASRRRRRLCRYLHSRVSGEEWDRVSPPARGRQAAPESGQGGGEVRGQGCRPGAAAVAKGVEWRKLEGDIKGELTYPRCFFLYNSLMFFIFRVRVKRRVRKGKRANLRGQIEARAAIVHAF